MWSLLELVALLYGILGLLSVVSIVLLLVGAELATNKWLLQKSEKRNWLRLISNFGFNYIGPIGLWGLCLGIACLFVLDFLVFFTVMLAL